MGKFLFPIRLPRGNPDRLASEIERILGRLNQQTIDKEAKQFYVAELPTTGTTLKIGGVQGFEMPLSANMLKIRTAVYQNANIGGSPAPSLIVAVRNMTTAQNVYGINRAMVSSGSPVWHYDTSDTLLYTGAESLAAGEFWNIEVVCTASAETVLQDLSIEVTYERFQNTVR